MSGLDGSKSSSKPISSVPASGRMQAVLQEGYGGTEVLRLRDTALPESAEKEVLVRVHSAGLAKEAWHTMTGTPYLLGAAVGLGRPRQAVLGRNLAGTVVAVGSGVTRFAPGDTVYGIGKGSFAQYTAALESKLAPMPANLDFDQAAVVPVSGLTALRAVDIARVSAGQNVLVLGAAGGVGSFGVQLAAAAGAEVTGACSSSKAGFVRGLGAAHTLDYRTEDFEAVPDRYDAIIDIAGNPSLGRLRRALKPGGTAAIVGGEEGGRLTGGMIERQLGAAILSLFGHQRLKGALAKESGRELERITPLIESGTVTPRVDSRYPLADFASAMERLESGQVTGSIVLTIRPDSSDG